MTRVPHAMLHNARHIIGRVIREVTACDQWSDVRSIMMRPLSAPVVSPSCVLHITCKYHKPQGRIKCINLHTAPTYQFTGLSRLVRCGIEAELRRITYILNASAQLVRELMSVPCDEYDLLARIDVEQRFLSGSAEQAISECTWSMPND